MLGAPRYLALIVVVVFWCVGAAAVENPADGSPFGLRTRISDFVRARAPFPPSKIDVPDLSQFRVTSPSGAPVEVRLAARAGQRFIGAVQISVVLSAGGRTLRRAAVPVGVHVELPVALAAHPLRRGMPLRQKDLLIEPREVAELPHGFVVDPSRLVGQRLKRSVRAGAVLQEGWVEEPPLVVRGQVVQLRLERGPLVIEGKGLARQDGHKGEWIRVVNTDSRREILGQVRRGGVIHVDF